MNIVRKCQSIYDEEFTLEISEDFLKKLDIELHNQYHNLSSDLIITEQDVADAIEDAGGNDTIDIIIDENDDITIGSFIREFVDNIIWDIEPKLYHNETIEWEDTVCD